MNRYRTSGLLLFLVLVLAASQAGFSQTSDRDRLASDIASLRAKLDAKTELLLSPSTDDKKTYATYLGQKDRGLIRLTPRGKYEKLLTIRGGGAYYSFTRKTHDYGFGSDVELSQGTLSVGFAGADFGFIANLGEMPLDTIGLDHPSLRFLVAYSPPTVEADARKERRRGGRDGFQVDDITLKDSEKAKLNSTYVLRSIDYGVSDVLVALQVVREDADGSLILTWRMLREFPKPQLVREGEAPR